MAGAAARRRTAARRRPATWAGTAACRRRGRNSRCARCHGNTSDRKRRKRNARKRGMVPGASGTAILRLEPGRQRGDDAAETAAVETADREGAGPDRLPQMPGDQGSRDDDDVDAADAAGQGTEGVMKRHDREDRGGARAGRTWAPGDQMPGEFDRAGAKLDKNRRATVAGARRRRCQASPGVGRRGRPF